MKKQILIFTVLLLLLLPFQTLALRCGSALVDVGDLKIEVRLACGEPLFQEEIGYIDQVRYRDPDDDTDSERIRVMAIEEWIVKEGNNYYSLIFEGNKLKKIEWADRK